jgi:hypothetical protein
MAGAAPAVGIAGIACAARTGVGVSVGVAVGGTGVLVEAIVGYGELVGVLVGVTEAGAVEVAVAVGVPVAVPVAVPVGVLVAGAQIAANATCGGDAAASTVPAPHTQPSMTPGSTTLFAAPSWE